MDRCVCCGGTIWPWQKGGAVYNSSWHKKCEYASQKGSEQTRAGIEKRMTRYGLWPPWEVMFEPEFELYEHHLKRMEGIRSYLAETWDLIGGDQAPEWSIDAELYQPITAPEGHRLLVVDGTLVAKKNRGN